MIIMIIITVICCQVLRPRSFPSWTPSGMSRFTAGAPLLGTGLTNHRRATIDASQAKMLGNLLNRNDDGGLRADLRYA
jgi:hypothetical protein